MLITSYDVELKEKCSILVKNGAFYHDIDRLDSAKVIVNMLNTSFRLNQKAEEHLYLLAMDTKCVAIGVFLLSKGTVDDTVVGIREIFTRLCLCGSSNFVLIHNHPSGNPEPSGIDQSVTQKIKDISEIMGVNFLDHIIVGGKTYWSFNENGFVTR